MSTARPKLIAAAALGTAALLCVACAKEAPARERSPGATAKQRSAAEQAPGAAVNETDGERRAPKPIQPTPPLASPWLWTVSKEGAAPSVLFGTLRGGVGLEEALGEGGERALAAARVLVLPTDAGALPPAEVLARAKLPPKTQLTRLIEPRTAAFIGRKLKAFQAADLLATRPWMLGPVLANDHLLGLSAGAPPMAVALRTKRPGVPLRYLESIGDELDAMDRVPLDCHGKLLDALVRDAEAGFPELEAEVAAYRAGDAARVLSVRATGAMGAACPAYASEVLGPARTSRWRPVLEQVLAAGGAFVAADLGALLGPEGVLGALEGAGFRVRRGVP